MPSVCQSCIRIIDHVFSLLIMPLMRQSCLWLVSHVFSLYVMCSLSLSVMFSICQSCLESVDHIFSLSMMPLFCQSCLQSVTHVYNLSIMYSIFQSWLQSACQSYFLSYHLIMSPVRQWCLRSVDHHFSPLVMSSVCPSCHQFFNHTIHVPIMSSNLDYVDHVFYLSIVFVICQWCL